MALTRPSMMDATGPTVDEIVRTLVEVVPTPVVA